MTKVEPSGDDTLDTILRQFAQMVLATGEMETDPGFLQGAATANVSKARTQLLQYIEGEITAARIEEVMRWMPITPDPRNTWDMQFVEAGQRRIAELKGEL